MGSHVLGAYLVLHIDTTAKPADLRTDVHIEAASIGRQV